MINVLKGTLSIVKSGILLKIMKILLKLKKPWKKSIWLINFYKLINLIINQIINLSINSNRIIYANPYKSISDIKHAIKQNIDMTVVDSVNELDKLRDNNLEVLVRIKVNDKDSLMPFSSKFGADFEETIDILKLAKKYNKNISGFSFHVGSGCYNPVQYYEAVKMIHDIMNVPL